MTTLLLAIVLVLQGQVTSPPGAGVVTGTLRDGSGKPQPGVRVAAMAVPDENTKGADVLVSISRTDETGRYRLDVPPGRYYIIAGRVDGPTYFPGVTDLPSATSMGVTPGSSKADVDFIVSSESLRASQNTLSLSGLTLTPKTLLAFMYGYSHTIGTAKFSFAVEGVSGRTVSFVTNSSRPFSYGCPDCAFFVREGGVGPQTSDAGVLLKLSTDGQRLDFTCHASQCNVAEVTSARVVISRLNRAQTGTAGTMDLVAFAVIP